MLKFWIDLEPCTFRTTSFFLWGGWRGNTFVFVVHVTMTQVLVAFSAMRIAFVFAAVNLTGDNWTIVIV